MTLQATRKKWIRARAKGPSRGTEWAQRSSDTEGSSDELSAEPSTADRRQWWDSKIEQKSLNKIKLKAILKTHADDARPVVDGMGHFSDQGIQPRSGQQAETDPDLRGKGDSRPAIRRGILGPGRVSSAVEQHSGQANSTKAYRLSGLDWNLFCQTKSATRSGSAGWTRRTKQTSRESR